MIKYYIQYFVLAATTRKFRVVQKGNVGEARSWPASHLLAPIPKTKEASKKMASTMLHPFFYKGARAMWMGCEQCEAMSSVR